MFGGTVFRAIFFGQIGQVHLSLQWRTRGLCGFCLWFWRGFWYGGCHGQRGFGGVDLVFGQKLANQAFGMGNTAFTLHQTFAHTAAIKVYGISVVSDVAGGVEVCLQHFAAIFE